MRLLDTHLHLLYPGIFTYEWCASVPALGGPFAIDSYAALLAQSRRGAVVERAIFMEVDVPEAQQQNEAEFFCDLAAQGEADGSSPLCAVVASCRPETDGFAAHAEKLAANPRVKGLRRILHTVDDALSGSATFVENINRLPALGLSFDLCLRADQLRLGMALADRCPKVQFILDHCGVPGVAAQALDPWRDDMRELAKRQNVACKISGITAYADAKKPLTAQLRPFVEHSVAAFGWNRVVWGSDWPVCNLTFGLPDWLDTTVELFTACSAKEKEQVGFRNAEQIYRL